MQIKLGINGANGRMGQCLGDLVASKQKIYDIAARLSKSSRSDEVATACTLCDIILDFSSPNGVESIISHASNSEVKLLIGTTGLQNKHFDLLANIAQTRAVLYAQNTSVSANLIAVLAAQASKILNTYDVEIVDTHHRHKKDAPSGTAIMIGQQIAAAKKLKFNDYAVFNRNNGYIRKNNEIGFSSIRGGEIYGDNEVIFAGDNEVLAMNCRALSRYSFAEGALLAARWLNKQPPGLYSMQDFLTLPGA